MKHWRENQFCLSYVLCGASSFDGDKLFNVLLSIPRLAYKNLRWSFWFLFYSLRTLNSKVEFRHGCIWFALSHRQRLFQIELDEYKLFCALVAIQLFYASIEFRRFWRVWSQFWCSNLISRFLSAFFRQNFSKFTWGVIGSDCLTLHAYFLLSYFKTFNSAFDVVSFSFLPVFAFFNFTFRKDGVVYNCGLWFFLFNRVALLAFPQSALVVYRSSISGRIDENLSENIQLSASSFQFFSQNLWSKSELFFRN